MPVCPLPVRNTVRDVLADLLGRDVQIAPVAPQTLDAGRPAYAATYVWDDGRVAAVAICDLPLAAGAASAISMVPADEASAGGGTLNDDQRESFHEVVNVLAKVLNSPETPHVTLRSVDAVPGDVPRDLADLVLSPSARQDHAVTVDGYGSGTLTLLA